MPLPKISKPLHHPTLNCKLTGKTSKTTIQYRGIKYASIPGRWEESVSVDTLPVDEKGIFNATTFGPSCPQKKGAQAWDLTLIGNEILEVEEGQGDSEKMNEFECLHVNITVPKGLEEGDAGGEGRAKGRLLPVFVWVHGGGLSMGSNSWPQYDLEKFVARSVQIGKPIIGVAINYRIGVFGFLASRELGVEGNLGFKDQVNAFRWLKMHIRGFGGDPDNITAAGESAGGISLSTLLCADVGERLFDRVAVMSGEVTLRKPRRKRWHEGLYKDQLKMLGLEGLGPEERTGRMRDMSAEEMAEKLPLAQHFCAVVDGIWLKSNVELSMLADGGSEMGKPGWCKEFVIGDCAADGTILKGRILDDPQAHSRLISLLSTHLTPLQSSNLLSAYSLTSPSSSVQTTFGLRNLATELRWYLPSLVVHEGWKSAQRKRARYHFHVLNPFEGMHRRTASHELDVAFLLQHYTDRIPSHLAYVAKQMADLWIGLANGEGLEVYMGSDTWGSGSGDQVIIISDGGVESLSEEDYDDVYRNGRGRILQQLGREVGLDNLWKVADLWQGVRQEEENGIKAKL
ncbi:alpha/beta-hydrolase [Amniculicola lignicola CBS 123094]|uniref:Alpha/beta-hydrolase n=1 Tax=Amniculicola lignicola CBS 123094 TaxID=1392246 RepID=A0A6A5WBS0_9PLEO|nr:alpha/beta-hydrolase [Amniculicola lignicola CBS 123094]